MKQDAIPWFVRDAWFKVDQPETYRGQCADLCGKDHGFMPIVVEAEAKYKEWVAQGWHRVGRFHVGTSHNSQRSLKMPDTRLQALPFAINFEFVLSLGGNPYTPC